MSAAAGKLVLDELQAPRENNVIMQPGFSEPTGKNAPVWPFFWAKPPAIGKNDYSVQCRLCHPKPTILFAKDKYNTANMMKHLQTHFGKGNPEVDAVVNAHRESRNEVRSAFEAKSEVCVFVFVFVFCFFVFLAGLSSLLVLLRLGFKAVTLRFSCHPCWRRKGREQATIFLKIISLQTSCWHACKDGHQRSSTSFNV